MGKPTQRLWRRWLIGACAATQQQLCDALGVSKELNPVYRRLVKMALEELQLIEQQMDQLDHEIAELLSQHQTAVQRLAEVPGLGVDSAHQIIAEVGAAAATFPSEKHARLMGRGMPRTRGERGSFLKQPISEGEPFHAASSQSGCQRRGQG